MAFSRPTLQEIVDRIQSDMITRITGATSLLRRSILTVLGRAYSGAVHLLYGNIEYNKDQLFITTADAEHLEIHSTEYGISKTAAVKATGVATATGTNGTIIPALSELESTSGIRYLTDASVTIAGGVGVLALTAVNAGVDGNEDGSTTLTFVSPIAGIDSNVTVGTDGISNGADEETDEALRDRTLTRKRQPPHGGAEFDYETWALEVSGVTRAWSIPLYQGVGTVGLSFVRDNDSDIIPSESEKTTVSNYIISHTDPVTGKTVGIPTTAEPGFFLIDNSTLAVDLSIAIAPNTTDVQTAVTSQLEDLILEDGGAEQTIKLSKIGAAISASTGETDHEVLTSSGLTATASQVQVLGTITWSTKS